MASDGSSFNLSSSIHADYCHEFGDNPVCTISVSDVRRNLQGNPAATATSCHQAGQTAVSNIPRVFRLTRQS